MSCLAGRCFFRAGPSQRDTESRPSAPDVSLTTNLFHPRTARLGRAGLGGVGPAEAQSSLSVCTNQVDGNDLH